MPIKWTEKMSVANDAIDSDHKQLIDLINTIEDCLFNSSDFEALISAMKKLEKYTYAHFEREQNIMKRINYPRHFQHFKSHHDLKNQYEQIKSRVFEDINLYHEVREKDELYDILRAWLIDHVLGEDLLMKPFLSQYPPDSI